MCILLLILTMLSGHALAADPISKSQIIVFGANNDENTFVGKLAILVYNEAFKRLKMDYQIRIFPLKRLDMSTRSGIVDGDIARTALWGKDRTDLVRIEEPVMYLTFNLYSGDKNLVINHPSDISDNKLTINYPRGMTVCEKFAKKILPLNQVEDVTTTEEGVRRLLIRNVYVHCDLEENVETYLFHANFKSDIRNKIKKIFTLESRVPIYPYLLKKHSQVAQKLGHVLKQMRSEGLLDKYQKQVEKEFRIN